MIIKPTYQELEKELENLKKINLSHSVEQLINLYENTSDGFVILNKNWEYTYLNKNAAKIFGRTQKDLLGKHIWTEFPEGIKQPFYKKYYKAIETQVQINFEDYYLPWDRWFENRIIPFNEGLAIFINDITEHKKHEQVLIESENKFRSFAENTPNIIFEINKKGEILYLNHATKGFTIDKFIGESMYLFMETNFHDSVKKIVGKVFKDGKQSQFETKGIEPYSEATNYLSNIGPIFNANNEVVSAIISTQDITHKIESEKALIESEQKLRTLYEKSRDAIIISENGKFIDVNDATFKMFGYTSKEEFLKVPLAKLSPKLQPNGVDSFENTKTMLFTAQEKGTHRFEWMFLKKNRKSFLVEILLTSISNQPTNKTIYGVLRNITDRKRIESELIESKRKAEESDRLKTEFISNMSHEIRTPMNGIMGFSELLNDTDLGDEKRKYFVNIIKNSGKQLLQVIDDIIEISKLGTKQVKVYEEKVVLNNLLLELFSIFDTKAKENKTPLYFKKGLSDKKSTILIDSNKLNKILSNLLDNALKFTNIGTIELGYKLINNNKVPVLEIYIQDTGVGIKPEDQKLIFERFVRAGEDTAKEIKGLGLGLSIANENVLLLGGEINVKSKKGKGTTFLIQIPYKPVFVDNENQGFKDKQVFLIVEDEEVNYLYISTLLVDLLKINCTIIHAKNGKEAIEICKNNPVIDLILMDLKMPVMNGFEASKEIKKRYPTIPIIAQTAYSTKAEKQRAIESGCSDFISKPISKESLYKVIKKFVPQV